MDSRNNRKGEHGNKNLRSMQQKLMKDLIYLLGTGMFTIAGVFLLVRIINEIKKIKMDAKDGNIKGVVVDWYILNTGDIRPVVAYTVNNEEKKYVYHFYHRCKEYPIGKEVYLKLSEKSGLAYDKVDLVKGTLFIIFSLVFFMFALLAGIYWILFIK